MEQGPLREIVAWLPGVKRVELDGHCQIVPVVLAFGDHNTRYKYPNVNGSMLLSPLDVLRKKVREKVLCRQRKVDERGDKCEMVH